ncbi:MAG: glycosyltransferase family 2 protein [Syntrophobacterales bacterium]|nr:glycosyltransferase family 2 protein [Syntrophobacterales bacterium]
MKESTATVVVTFHPPDELWENLKVIASQVDWIIIIDNTPGGINPRIQEERITILSNKRNIGLARAQNLGIGLAISMGYEWVLLLDQDSRPAPDFMERMGEYYKSLSPEDQSNLLMLTPNLYDNTFGFFYPRIVKSSFLFKRTYCKDRKGIPNALITISSGSLIPVRSFYRIGFMDDSLFIDHVDNDFCLRGLSSGLVIHVVCGALLFHRLGNYKKVYSMGSFLIKPSFYPPFRRYFIYRNRVLVWRRYFKKVPSFVLHDALVTLYDLLKIALLEDRRREKFKAIFEGILDGWKGYSH